jgi:hypothetical protein
VVRAEKYAQKIIKADPRVATPKVALNIVTVVANDK